MRSNWRESKREGERKKTIDFYINEFASDLIKREKIMLPKFLGRIFLSLALN